MLIAEMTLYYKKQGKTLYDALVEIYEQYGYFKESLVSVELKGKEGQEKIGRCLDLLRADEITEVNGVKVVKSFDYKSSTEKDLIANTTSKINLPKSNVLKYILEDDSWFVVRPSGTEPKMKVYLAVKGNSLEDADKQTERFKSSVMAIVNEKLN